MRLEVCHDDSYTEAASGKSLAFPPVAIAGQVGGRSGKLGGLRKSAVSTRLGPRERIARDHQTPGGENQAVSPGHFSDFPATGKVAVSTGSTVHRCPESIRPQTSLRNAGTARRPSLRAGDVLLLLIWLSIGHDTAIFRQKAGRALMEAPGRCGQPGERRYGNDIDGKCRKPTFLPASGSRSGRRSARQGWKRRNRPS